MTPQEAIAAWREDKAQLAARGIIMNDVVSYLPSEWKTNYTLAMDAQPALSTTANSGVPAMLTTMIDPEVTTIRFAPNKAAKIVGENRKGSWTDKSIIFTLVEHNGEVSSYGDYAENGHTGVNTNFPQRQSYLYQTIKEYGEYELDQAGLAKLDWVSQVDKAAATTLSKFENLTYFFGIQGLQCYGLLNSPDLPASITPATKANGGKTWMLSGVPNASAMEVYQDFQTLFSQLVSQSGGEIEANDEMVLCTSPETAVAFATTNSFGLDVYKLLKQNYPNIRFETAKQYGAITSDNPQGIAAGNLVQLFAVTNGDGQKTAFAAFNEKMRSHPIIRAMSSFKQKVTGGTWGTVIRSPYAFASMVGV